MEHDRKSLRLEVFRPDERSDDFGVAAGLKLPFIEPFVRELEDCGMRAEILRQFDHPAEIFQRTIRFKGMNKQRNVTNGWSPS